MGQRKQHEAWCPASAGERTVTRFWFVIPILFAKANFRNKGSGRTEGSDRQHQVSTATSRSGLCTTSFLPLTGDGVGEGLLAQNLILATFHSKELGCQ